MTNEQIKFILKNIGNYDVNKLIPLTEVSTIVMEGNMNIYPDPFTRFIFRDEKNIGLIEANRGYVGSDGVFVQTHKLPTFVVPFDQFEAFQLVSPTRRTAPYITGQSM